MDGPKDSRSICEGKHGVKFLKYQLETETEPANEPDNFIGWFGLVMGVVALLALVGRQS